MKTTITDLVRAKEELGPRVLIAIAKECAPFEHLRVAAVRGRLVDADMHRILERQLAKATS